MTGTILFWLQLLLCQFCPYWYPMSSPNIATVASVKKRENKCLCFWTDCKKLSNLLTQNDPQWAGFVKVKKNQRALRSSVEWHLTPSKERIAKGTEYHVARHHWPRQLVLDNAGTPGGNQAIFGILGGRRHFSTPISNSE